MTVFNHSVALPTGDLFVDMTLMVEQHMFGHIVHLDPGGGGLRVKIFVLFLDPGMFFYNIIMAVQALFHRGNTREI